MYTNKNNFGLDIYINKMFKILMIVIPCFALLAGTTFTVLTVLGYYKTVSLPGILIFDATCVIYFIIGMFFAFTYQDKNKNIKKNYVLYGKIFISLVIVIQWNFISYLIPSRDFWAYFSLFILAAVFFLDSKYVIINFVFILISIVISWLFKEDLRPVYDGYFWAEIVLRIIVILCVSWVLWFITYVVEKFLINELEKVAEVDTLTLLKNRRTLEPSLDGLIEQFKLNGSKFCFVMSDIDDFKKVNDTYGHDIGDNVLKDIAFTFKKVIEKSGITFRYGGEEICSIIYGNEEEAYKLIELLRSSLEKEEFVYGNIKLHITMSFGLAEYEEKLSKEDLIKKSDNNLYYAKNHGKNVVIK